MKKLMAAGIACVMSVGACLGQMPNQDEEPTLQAGDRAPELYISNWIKGAPVASFEPGRTYVVEFWATWCGPCIASMPHLTELQREYKDDVTVIGVSVDRDQDIVPDWVAKKGDEMGYTVCVQRVDGEGADAVRMMSTHWMSAAGQRGIPTSFIVDGAGKVAWIGHPMQMDEPLKQIVAGDWDIQAHAIEKRKADQAARRTRAMQEEIFRAMQAQRFDVAVQKVNDMLALDGEQYAPTAAQMFNSIAWDTLTNDEIENPDKQLALTLATRACDLTGYSDAAILDTLAKACFDTGDIANAIKWQQLAVDKLPDNAGEMRTELEERLVEYRRSSM